MMNTKNLSPLVLAILDLDADFESLERLRHKIEQADLTSESGLERAKNLLSKFSETGTHLGQSLVTFSKILNETRSKAESSAALVSEHANLIQNRQAQNNLINTRFMEIVEKVKTLTAQVAEVSRPQVGDAFSAEQKAAMPNLITELEFKLGALVEEMVALKNDSAAANLKDFCQSADALSQSMNASRRKLQTLLVQPPTSSQQPS